ASAALTKPGPMRENSLVSFAESLFAQGFSRRQPRTRTSSPGFRQYSSENSGCFGGSPPGDISDPPNSERSTLGRASSSQPAGSTIKVPVPSVKKNGAHNSRIFLFPKSPSEDELTTR